MDQEYLQDQRSDEFAVLKRFLPGNSEPIRFEEAAVRLNMSVAAVNSDVHRTTAFERRPLYGRMVNPFARV